jgi:hypothetical protein
LEPLLQAVTRKCGQFEAMIGPAEDQIDLAVQA